MAKFVHEVASLPDDPFHWELMQLPPSAFVADRSLFNCLLPLHVTGGDADRGHVPAAGRPTLHPAPGMCQSTVRSAYIHFLNLHGLILDHHGHVFAQKTPPPGSETLHRLLMLDEPLVRRVSDVLDAAGLVGYSDSGYMDDYRYSTGLRTYVLGHRHRQVHPSPPRPVQAADSTVISTVSSTYCELHAILAPYATMNGIEPADQTDLYVHIKYPQGTRQPLFFGAVVLKEGCVIFQLAPVCRTPALLSQTSAPLRARMQRKSCFRFSKPEPALFEELAALTKAVYASCQAPDSV